MATVQRFEDLAVWQLAREVSRVVYVHTRQNLFSKDFGLVNQIRNASGSVMDNIAEGFERGSRKEFAQFLTIAKGSAGEVRSQLQRALDQKYIDDADWEVINRKCLSLSQMLFAFIQHLNRTSTPGIRHKLEEPLGQYQPTLDTTN